LQINFRKALASDKSGAFNLEVSFTADDEVTILFGPSGSGKTTTLRAIAGIIQPDEGHIEVGGKTFFDSHARVNISIQDRRVGYVFQDYALFPHLTGEQNVAYGIKEKSEAMRRDRARQLLSLFKVEHIGGRYPQNMSGGEQQRIALARALASNPSIVLLDEPLSAVDLETRAGLLDEIASAQARFGIPFLYVTHNPTEARRLGTHAVVLEKGKVKTIGLPRDIFKQSS
jgi:molybdate transport system ATP-binding protein